MIDGLIALAVNEGPLVAESVADQLDGMMRSRIEEAGHNERQRLREIWGPVDVIEPENQERRQRSRDGLA
jgi:hypothetical protein